MWSDSWVLKALGWGVHGEEDTSSTSKLWYVACGSGGGGGLQGIVWVSVRSSGVEGWCFPSKRAGITEIWLKALSFRVPRVGGKRQGSPEQFNFWC